MSTQTLGWKSSAGESGQPAPGQVNLNKETAWRQHMNVHWLKLVYANLATVLVFLLLAPNEAPAQSGCSPAPSPVVAWWPAEDHAYDIIGKRFALLNGDATYAPGLVGKAFSFGGAGGRARILEAPANDLSRLPRWTIEAWVNPASFGNALYPTIFSEGNRIITLGLQKDTGRLESWVNNDGGRRL